MKKWGRKLPDRPTRKAVRAGIAAQAPPGWEMTEHKKKREKLVGDDIPDLMKDSPDDAS